jgi:hypothetical protein
VQLKFEGTGGLAYQVVGRYFTPWESNARLPSLSPSTLPTTARISPRTTSPPPPQPSATISKTANMVMVDLGIPPGFDLLSEDLQSFQEKSATSQSGRLEKFSLTATQAILYFNALSAEANRNPQLPPARQVPHPRPHLPVARLRVLRPGRERHWGFNPTNNPPQINVGFSPGPSSCPVTSPLHHPL